MHSSLQTILVLALAISSLALPQMKPIEKRGVFKVDRVANPNFVRSPGAGTRALIHAHRKYLVPLPQGLVDAMNEVAAANEAAGAFTAAAKEDLVSEGDDNNDSDFQLASTRKGGSGRKGKNGTGAAAPAAAVPEGTNTTAAPGTGIVAAVPQKGDTEFLSPVQIGGQTVNLDFDTGSSDLWVFNSQLDPEIRAGHRIFDVAQSSTFKMMNGATYSISYGDGSGTAGNVGTDTVNLGGATVTSQAIELATAVSASFIRDTQSSGLLGLAFSKLNTVKPVKQKTFFDNAIPSLAQPVFTADLRTGAPGAYTFGAIDTTKFNGTMQWTPVNTANGFWQFPSRKFQVAGGASINVPGGQAIADTGTTLMLVDPSVVNAYYSQVEGAVNNARAGGVTFPCNTVLPDLQFDVGGNFMATVRGSDINFAKVDSTGQTCFGGLQAIQSNLQIYGDIMFKSQFVAFNGGNNSLGFAPHQ